jgi:hypothetical protein
MVETPKNEKFPLEVLEVIPGQRYSKKLNERQTAEMIKFTQQPPDRRAQRIMNNMHMANFKENRDLSTFGSTYGSRYILLRVVRFEP